MTRIKSLAHYQPFEIRIAIKNEETIQSLSTRQMIIIIQIQM